MTSGHVQGVPIALLVSSLSVHTCDHDHDVVSISFSTHGISPTLLLHVFTRCGPSGASLNLLVTQAVDAYDPASVETSHRCLYILLTTRLVSGK